MAIKFSKEEFLKLIRKSGLNITPDAFVLLQNDRMYRILTVLGWALKKKIVVLEPGHFQNFQFRIKRSKKIGR